MPKGTSSRGDAIDPQGFEKTTYAESAREAVELECLPSQGRQFRGSEPHTMLMSRCCLLTTLPSASS